MATVISHLVTLPALGREATEHTSLEAFVASLIGVEPLVSVPPLVDFDFGLDEIISRITTGSDEGEDDVTAPSGAFLDVFELLTTPTETPAVHTHTDLCDSADLLAAIFGDDMFDFVSCPETDDDLTATGTPADALWALVTGDLPSGTADKGDAAAPAQAESTSDDVKIGELDAFDFLF